MDDKDKPSRPSGGNGPVEEPSEPGDAAKIDGGSADAGDGAHPAD